MVAVVTVVITVVRGFTMAVGVTVAMVVIVVTVVVVVRMVTVVTMVTVDIVVAVIMVVTGVVVVKVFVVVPVVVVVMVGTMRHKIAVNKTFSGKEKLSIKRRVQLNLIALNNLCSVFAAANKSQHFRILLTSQTLPLYIGLNNLSLILVSECEYFHNTLHFTSCKLHFKSNHPSNPLQELQAEPVVYLARIPIYAFHNDLTNTIEASSAQFNELYISIK